MERSKLKQTVKIVVCVKMFCVSGWDYLFKNFEDLKGNGRRGRGRFVRFMHDGDFRCLSTLRKIAE